MPDLDLVIPLYKTGPNLPALINRLNEWTGSVSLSVQVIFVDDGSPDRTFEALLKLLPTATFRYKALRLAVNYGQHPATALGFSHCEAPLVATLDDDLQHDPFQLDTLMECMRNGDLDLVYGHYEQKMHSPIRNLGSAFLKKLLFSKQMDYSSVTSFRLMKRSILSVFGNLTIPVLFVDEYLLRYALSPGRCVVKHYPRVGGKSSYSAFALMSMAMEIMLFHSSLPLKMITRLGLFISFVFFLLGCFYVWQKMANDVQLGFTSIIVALFFSTGMILLSLGIIGEYIRKIWITQHNLDRIIVAEEAK